MYEVAAVTGVLYSLDRAAVGGCNEFVTFGLEFLVLRFAFVRDRKQGLGIDNHPDLAGGERDQPADDQFRPAQVKRRVAKGKREPAII